MKSGLQRSVIIFDEQGVLRRGYYVMTLRQHTKEMLNRIREMDEVCR